MFHKRIAMIALVAITACSQGASNTKASADSMLPNDTTEGFRDRFSDINPTPLAVTERRISILGDWVRHFQRTNGRLPARLEEILPPDTSDRNFQPHERWWRDGWNRLFEYSQQGTTCELRSRGEDGESGTADDVVRTLP